MLVGEGDLRNSLEKYIKINDIKNIFFTGFINQNELPVFYTMADLFVLPSGLGETWGLVLNEAMNYDLPIVVSETVGSCDDLVLDNGVTFKEGDIQELSCKIKNLLSDGNLLNMGKRSYQVIQKYSYEHIEESILEIINKVTAIK